jgi:hypothetical protein
MIITRSRLIPLVVALASTPVFASAQGTRPDSTRKTSDTTYAPSPPPKDTTHHFQFSSWVFGDYQVETDSATKAQNGGKATDRFEIGRAYLTFLVPLSDRIGARVTTDIKQGASGSGYQGLFIRLKYAYLQYTFLRPQPSGNGLAALARIGMLHTVIIDHEETFWPRYLGQVPLERLGFFASADLGAATLWTLPSKLGEVYGTITNGNGYEQPETDRFKDFALRVSITPLGRTSGLLKTLTISPWGYGGDTASKFATSHTSAITSGLEKRRYGVFAGIKDPRLTIAGEWAQRVSQVESGATPATRTVARVTGQLWDTFAIVRPIQWGNPKSPSTVGAVFRIDRFKPDRSVSGNTQYIIGGVFWEPTPKAAVAVDYQRSEPRDGLSGTITEQWFVHWQLVF